MPLIQHDTHVEPATDEHLPSIRSAYAYARAIQRREGGVVWPEFTDAAICADIERRTLYRVTIGDELAGVFSMVYEDAAIWGALECGRHVYLHRFARAGANGSHGLVPGILGWAGAHCRALGRMGLRMDTWADNDALVGFYMRNGFQVVGRRRIGMDPRLPADYHGRDVALLEQHQPREGGAHA